MLIFKMALYSATLIAAFLFAFMELRIKCQLTEDRDQPSANASDLGFLNYLSDSIRREQVVALLPQRARSRLRMIVALKFVCVLTLVVELLLLQR